MTAFTLDTNCLIDADEGRPAAKAVLTLLHASREGRATVAMAVSSASERQQDGTFLKNIELFRDRMSRLGFGDVELLPGIQRYGMGFWGHGLYADASMKARAALIFSTMFPTHAAEWSDYAAQKGVDPALHDSPDFLRWRNKIIDAQAFWTHEHHRRQVFVTSDAKFKRLNGAANFPAARVLTPDEALSCL